MSPAWVLMHARHLEIESSFVAELRGGQQFRGWGPDRYLRAGQLNTGRIGNWMFVMANIPKTARKPAEPEMYPMPDVVSKTRLKPADKPGGFAATVRSLSEKAKKRMEGGA